MAGRTARTQCLRSQTRQVRGQGRCVRGATHQISETGKERHDGRGVHRAAVCSVHALEIPELTTTWSEASRRPGDRDAARHLRSVAQRERANSQEVRLKSPKSPQFRRGSAPAAYRAPLQFLRWPFCPRLRPYIRRNVSHTCFCPLLPIMTPEYKAEKEASVSFLGGGGIWEINYVTVIAPVSPAVSRQYGQKILTG